MRHQDRRQRAPAREAEGRDAPGLAGGPAVVAPRRIVCLGDSTTLGWPPTLRDLLGKQAMVVNGARGGMTIAQILGRMDELVHAPAPFDVCVLAGVNDLRGDRAAPAIRTDLAAVYARIVARGGVPLPVTILPFGGHPTWSPAREAERVQVNAWIRTLPYRYTDAEAIGDGHPAQPALQAAYSANGLHPNRRGHAVLARMIYTQSFRGAPTPLPDSSLPDS